MNHRTPFRSLPALAAAGAALCCVLAPVAAAEPVLEQLAQPPGQPLPAFLSGTLSPTGWRVRLDGGQQLDFWFCKELPLGDQDVAGFGASFGRIPTSALVGAVRLHSAWHDYKDSVISPGVYSLRFGLQPADGNHMGVTSYRDFLLLSPAAGEQAENEGLDEDALTAKSRLASGVAHPAVMALFPVFEETSQVELTRNELDQLTLAVPISGVTLGLVIDGHGHLEGY